MPEDFLKFRISSALKNLIGKELITDQYVAIFELVKNSFDAKAKNVKITFENIYNVDKAKIIIEDDGKGMNYLDLINKWLFVAYSAKSEGTEDIDDYADFMNDESYKEDYRDKIMTKRVYAGAKGVGRFSCDRLGQKLLLITKKDEDNSIIECLDVNWRDFENDSHKEFINIPVKHMTMSDKQYDINHGTILQIFELRDAWDREKLMRLKRSLEKLINPIDHGDDFSIRIVANEEVSKDNDEKHDRDKVNGLIKNTVFETLGIKTTQIVSEISDNGDTITSTLRDRGALIYEITEKNPYKTLTNIKINLFQLNQASKYNFSSKMGVTPINYGSIFVYKNGFRIYPYGEAETDIFDINSRKMQGYNRYLGTRDLIGRIEIVGNEESLKETTSRDGGFIKNPSYYQLSSFFLDKALKRLEKYIGLIKWGEPDPDNDNKIIEPKDIKDEILDIIRGLTRASDIIKVDYDNNIMEVIGKRQEQSAVQILKNLSKSAEKINDPALIKDIEKTKKQFSQLLTAKKELEVENDKSNLELQNIKQDLESTVKQNIFLRTITTTDIKDIFALQHHIDRSSEKINIHLDSLISLINSDSPKKQLLDYVKKISFENQKIATVAKFVTKANFNLTAETIEDDLVQFVDQYIENVYKEYDYLKINKHMLNIEIKPHNDTFAMRFRPLEIIFVLDNLLSNCYKAQAKNVTITWAKHNNNSISLSIIDDGKGIVDGILDKIFEFGFTTTDGSGIGLYHIKDIVENRMKGKISVNNKLDKGVEFTIEVVK